jgi:hypothetical protein
LLSIAVCDKHPPGLPGQHSRLGRGMEVIRTSYVTDSPGKTI